MQMYLYGIASDNRGLWMCLNATHHKRVCVTTDKKPQNGHTFVYMLSK